ncbi:uncharacterized protein PS065_019237 [Dugong dugon]
MGPREPPLRGANSKKPIVSGLSDRGHGKQRGQRTKAPGSHPRGSPDLETATRPNAALQPHRREQRRPSEPGTQAKGGGGGRKRSARCQQTAPRKPPARARGTQAPAPPRPGTPATESRGVNEQRPRDPTHAGAQTQKQPHARTQLHSPAGESRDSTRTQAPRQKEGEAAEKGPLGASKRLPESPQPGRAEPKHRRPPAQGPRPRKAEGRTNKGPGIPPTREPRPRNSHTPARSPTAPQERAETALGTRHPGKRRGRRQRKVR